MPGPTMSRTSTGELGDLPDLLGLSRVSESDLGVVDDDRPVLSIRASQIPGGNSHPLSKTYPLDVALGNGAS